MSARLTWVNHASYVLATGDTHLMTDPWLFGSAFNRGWDLVSASRWTAADFARITHIWFSHEHPDHFSPQVLRTVPEERRGRICVLYQATRDRKVLSHCESLGFAVRELRDREWLSLGPGMRVMCGRVPLYDSWLLTEIDGLRVLNTNDCELPTARSVEEVRRSTGAVDVLLTQFSYANRVGDVDERDKREAAAREKLERVRVQVDGFGPAHTVLFASFIYFSHEENAYLNDGANLPDAAARYVRERTGSVPLVFYPGDEWDLRARVDCESALARYRADYEAARSRPKHRSEKVSVEELESLAGRYLERIRRQNSRFLTHLLSGPPLPFFSPLTIYLRDLDRTVDFDLRSGLRPSARPKSAAELWTDAENLAFVFRFDWGADTLYVNGRFRCPTGAHGKAFRGLSLGTLNNGGRRLGLALAFDFATLLRAFRFLLMRPRFMR